MWFSFALAFGSMFGLWLTSRNPKAGWAWCIFMEFLWIFWAYWLEQWGFLLLCACYGGVYLYNLSKVTKERE
jgi:hypothetical protein